MSCYLPRLLSWAGKLSGMDTAEDFRIIRKARILRSFSIVVIVMLFASIQVGSRDREEDWSWLGRDTFQARGAQKWTCLQLHREYTAAQSGTVVSQERDMVMNRCSSFGELYSELT